MSGMSNPPDYNTLLNKPVMFESAEITISTGTVTTIAHGLGTRPKQLEVWARCKTAQYGHAVGDEIKIGETDVAIAATRYYGAGLSADANNIYLVQGANACYITDRATPGTWNGISDPNWKLFVRAWDK